MWGVGGERETGKDAGTARVLTRQKQPAPGAPAHTTAASSHKYNKGAMHDAVAGGARSMRPRAECDGAHQAQSSLGMVSSGFSPAPSACPAECTTQHAAGGKPASRQVTSHTTRA